jgi:hypothetical protein
MVMVMKMQQLMMMVMMHWNTMIRVAARMVPSAIPPRDPSEDEVSAISGGPECWMSNPSSCGESI